MQLIKITPNKVQIKSNTDQLGDVTINNAILATGEDGVALVCTVTAISRNEQEEQFDCETGELLEPDATSTIDCSIIGSLVNGKFAKAVDRYPSTNVKIEPIEADLFRSMLADDVPSGFRLGAYAAYGCPAMLDGNRLFQRHSAILGNTGSGKSFLISSILERVSELKNANVILFDVHGEYQGLSYVRQIKIGEGGMDFPLWFLPLRDIYGNLLRMKEESATLQVAALRRAFYKARGSEKSEELPISFDLKWLICDLENENEEEIYTGEYYKTGEKAGRQKTVRGENYGKLTNVISLLEDKRLDRRYEFMIKDHGQSYLNEFVSEVFGTYDKNVKVIDLSEVPGDMIPTIIAVIAKLIYRVQLQQERGDLVPLSIIADEAHVYIPSSDFGIGASQRRLLEIFETIAKEGRKFGVSLMVASQRPSELNRTIMAQCANYIVLKMSNDADKQMIKGILPEGSRGLIDAVNLFAPGDCLVVGDAAPITFKVRADLPSEAPNSNTINTWDVWQQEREINTDLLIESLMRE